MDWYDFLDTQFSFPKNLIKTRDRVVVKCPDCGASNIIQVKNLKTQIKRIGTHLCWSCSAKNGYKKGNEKRKETMIKRYGVEFAQQNQDIKEKTKKNRKKD